MNTFRMILAAALAAAALWAVDSPCQAQSRSNTRHKKKDDTWFPKIDLMSYRVPIVSDSIETVGASTKKAVTETKKALGLGNKLPGSDLIVTPLKRVGKTTKETLVKTTELLSPKKLGLPRLQLPKVPDELNPLTWPAAAGRSLSKLAPASWTKPKKRSGPRTTGEFLRQPSATY